MEVRTAVKPLRDLIEIIKTKKTLTAEDQSQLNTAALNRSPDEEDAQALADLTSLINEGKVTVL